MFTHPGFSGSNYFGWLDITNPAAPRWHAGNLLGTGAIATLGSLTAGTGYVPGTYLNVPLTGGAGSGASADIVVNGSGHVASVTLDTFGSAYAVSDSLSASNTNLGGSGSGFAIVVATIQTAGLIQFSTPPSWVRQFNQRAYFGVNPPTGLPSVVFTDPLVLGCTNANQALTFGDTTPLVAASPLPLSNQLGGIIQSLIIFKSLNGIVQITGDAATTNLAINALQGGSGTLAPRSIVSLPTGIAYLDHDGISTIDFDANDLRSDRRRGHRRHCALPLAGCAVARERRLQRLGAEDQRAELDVWPASRGRSSGTISCARCGRAPTRFPSTCIDVYGPAFVLAPQSVTGEPLDEPDDPDRIVGLHRERRPAELGFQTAMWADNGQMAQGEVTEMQVKTSAVQPVTTINVVARREPKPSRFVSLFTAGRGDLGTRRSGIRLWDAGSTRRCCAAHCFSRAGRL